MRNTLTKGTDEGKDGMARLCLKVEWRGKSNRGQKKYQRRDGLRFCAFMKFLE